MAIPTKRPGTARNWTSRIRRYTTRPKQVTKYPNRIEKTDLPEALRTQVKKILALRSHRDLAIISAGIPGTGAVGWEMTNLSLGLSGITTIPALLGAGLTGFGIGIAREDHLKILQQTKALGDLIISSNDPKIQQLRKNFKYVIVGWDGSLKGTNRNPTVQIKGRTFTLGRKRMQT